MAKSLKLNNSKLNKNLIYDIKIIEEEEEKKEKEEEKKEKEIKLYTKKDLKIPIIKNIYHYTNFLDNLD